MSELGRGTVARLKPPLALPVSTIGEAKRILDVAAVVAVVTDDGELLGRVVSSDESTLVLRVSPDIDAEIPVEDIHRIDRVESRGMEGAMLGAAVGCIPLALFSWMFGEWVRSGAEYYWILFALFALPVVGGLGAIGGIIGLALQHRQPIFAATAAI